MGKSSSRKLRYVIYYTLYRRDPQKTLYTIRFSATFLKIQNFRKLGENPYIFPPNSRSTAPLRRLFMLKNGSVAWAEPSLFIGVFCPCVCLVREAGRFGELFACRRVRFCDFGSPPPLRKGTCTKSIKNGDQRMRHQ